MKLVIQRVNHASVTVEGKVTGEIKKGYLVLLISVYSCFVYVYLYQRLPDFGSLLYHVVLLEFTLLPHLQVFRPFQMQLHFQE